MGPDSSLDPPSCSDRPSRKRPRTESESDDRDNSDKSTWSRDEQFWLTDGNIIIVAQDVGFRTYKGWLAVQSEVFRDMFSIAQPATADLKQADVSEGCPVVHVTDTAAEIRSLLSVLFSGRNYMRRQKLSFADIANCTRLAHKYVIQDLLEDSLEDLKQYFPETFDLWDKRLHCNPRTRAIEAVNLARITGTTSIIPAALYSCAQLNGSRLLKGCVREDGVVETLSTEDLSRCIDAKQDLSARTTRLICQLFDTVENSLCRAFERRCNASIAGVKAFLLKSERGLQGGTFPALGSWKTYISEHDSKIYSRVTHPICSSCITVLCRRETDLRTQVWSELPKLLCLDDDDASSGTEGEKDEDEDEDSSEEE
ncbi:hypothetical protein FOMPIDRAFT_1059356 [Fomitopsis schrenkii]|uniref:BTB domain-containing protein n=1 Tax=Fomitopsis schrenkii TaxID=2126942 RepID=S8EBQ6_FOMSC|nr:hypothetical protein FOMPIDRAFT_1059356 [Fomitopsis schrenkii]